jgi:hypothetical protein
MQATDLVVETSVGDGTSRELSQTLQQVKVLKAAWLVAEEYRPADELAAGLERQHETGAEAAGEHGLAFRTGYRLMNRAARYRWRHRYFGFPVELKLANSAARRLRGFL